MSEDPITTSARMAFEAHERGEITREALVEILRMCINAAAKCNGYAERLGLPFPNVG